MSEKSFSCKDCNKVTSDKEYEIVDYEELNSAGYCIDCFLDNHVSDDECFYCGYAEEEKGSCDYCEPKECVNCGGSVEESYTKCDSCDALFCKTCDEYEDERFVTETISPTFCTDQDACLKRRIKVLMTEPSRYRNSEDIEAITKLENKV